MRKLLPLALLIPPVLLMVLWIASLFGYRLPHGTPASLLIGAVAWTLLFLIIYGYMRRWDSVRAFLVLYALWEFSAILYDELTSSVPIGRLLLELAAAAVLAWLMFGFFWPRPWRYEKTSA
jgi:hypothetical protein